MKLDSSLERLYCIEYIWPVDTCIQRDRTVSSRNLLVFMTVSFHRPYQSFHLTLWNVSPHLHCLSDGNTPKNNFTCSLRGPPSHLIWCFTDTERNTPHGSFSLGVCEWAFLSPIPHNGIFPPLLFLLIPLSSSSTFLHPLSIEYLLFPSIFIPSHQYLSIYLFVCCKCPSRFHITYTTNPTNTSFSLHSDILSKCRPQLPTQLLGKRSLLRMLTLFLNVSAIWTEMAL